MEFNRRYNRSEFINFLQHHFLPEDFVTETTQIDMVRQTQYIRSITKLGSCETLDLVVYEVRHSSTHDARVGLSKEAFRFLADEWESKALVLFVPEGNDTNYRFSLITIDLSETPEGKLHKVYSNPRRYSYYLGEGIACYTPNKYLNTLGRVTDDKDLTERFSVEVLTKAFYQELSDWYAWAVKVVRFPNKLDDTTDDDKYNHEAAIRLVTRLIFVWFLKQKNLIPNEFFDEEYIRENLIEGFNPRTNRDLFYNSGESKYYKAILQNLFFAMLNSPITPEGSTEISERRFRENRGAYDNNKLMRYKSLFKNPELFVKLANKTVPFLNGGLFDCLDDKDKGNYLDGFSDRTVVKEALIVPDFLFFGDEVGRSLDLSDWYGDKKKKRVSARGILEILKQYNFTVEENTPFDQDVSLDPELLGKVFENLLASYNPETQTTARKQTGSFYTPRDIVQYMVDESLVAHLKRIVGEELEPEYRKLISYVDEDIQLTTEQKLQIMEAIYHCKVLDPACGSGAFPVGMLQQMVHILFQLDPSNEQWKRMLLEEAVSESRNAFQTESKEEREERLKDIETSFDESLNNPDYARKLYLIENCIYGVDIQPIAIQISKLRFFISLVVDQKTTNDPVKNFGIRPLPNLEAKFVAANSLIPLAKSDGELGRTPEIIELENKLKEANHKIFSAKTVRTKRRWKDRLLELRTEMADKLKDNGFLTADAANQLASWNMFDQNSAATFFDADWMFGVKYGFDVVIGNPPYIRPQNLSPSTKNLLWQHFITFKKKADFYVCFLENGIKSLSVRGILSMIVSNGWLRLDSFEAIREYILTQTSICQIVDFSEDVFESAVVKTNIVITSKRCENNNNLYAACLSNTRDLKDIKFKIIPQNSFKTNHKKVFDLSFDIFSAIIKGKIEEKSLLIGNRFNLSFGLKTGDDSLFLTFINSDERCKKLLRGADISRYSYLYKGEYVIYDPIAMRNNKTTARPGSKERFEQPKILVRDTGNGLNGTYDDECFYVKDVIILSDENKCALTLKMLIALLNSKAMKYYYETTFPTLHVQRDELAVLPVKKSYIENPNEFIISLVDKILLAKKINPNADTRELENQIDFFVYRLYSLTYDEVLIVDPNTPITREEYEK